ncbi:dermonecrotic toxin domain-containing protein [Pseudomonas sp. UV AK001]|uniref:dermonecrotic toxin domain-containing protein n=1 Tax=Pseudomonas sp. UV AK001 TaxID=3384791 RepID=UPI0038D4C561
MLNKLSSAVRNAPIALSQQTNRFDEHYEIVKSAASPAFLDMSESNRKILKSFTPSTPDWLVKSSAQQRAEVRGLVDQSLAAHTVLSREMAGVKSAHAFASVLLKKKFNEIFSLDFDIEKGLDWSVYGEHHGATLIQAALQNFSHEDQFRSIECNEEVARGRFERVPFDVSKFVTLCRELDLGTHYQQHIKSQLNWDDPAAQGRLSDAFIGYHKAALKAASLIAWRKGDIEEKHHQAIMAIVNGDSSVRIDGRPVWYRGLSFMEMPLHSCLVLEIADADSDSVWDDLASTFGSEIQHEFIVYIPDDPDHPVKHYSSIEAFKARLIQQFTKGASSNAPTPYQQFFSRFTRYEDRARFLRSFTEEVPTPFLERQRGIHYLERRQKAAPDFLLQFTVLDPSGELWEQRFDLWTMLHQHFRQRILRDARHQAVPTEDVDANARHATIILLVQFGLMALNVFSLAVPPLGAVMLGVNALQMMYEVLEGLDELSIGDKEVGWQHINDVLGNLAVGAALLPLAGVASAEFTPIELASGQKRLWKPELSAYRSRVSLNNVEPNFREQYRIGDKWYVRLDGHAFEKRFDPLTDTWRIVHPTNPDAYQPILAENSDGWYHTLERPTPHPLKIAPIKGEGIDTAIIGRHAVDEALILGLKPSRGIYRSIDSQWCYIRNIDDAGIVSVYRIRDSFNLNAEIVDVNIVDPQSNRATELRLREVAPDQWQPLSLRGGARSGNSLDDRPAFVRKQLPNGLWEPAIEVVPRSDVRHLPFDWGSMHELPFSIEPTSIHQSLEMPELGRRTIATDLIEGGKAGLSQEIASQLDRRNGGGSFLFTMQRMKYSGAVEGEFNALKVIDLEAGERPDQANAISAYWSPQGGYVDVPVHPEWAQPDHVFTPGFSGCSLVVDQMDENLLRVRHVEGGKEAPQYNDLAPEEHGWGLSAAMEFPDYGLRLDQNGNPDSILTGFAFMKYDRTARVWKLHYQSNQGATAIGRYSREQPGWFSRPDTLARVYGRTKVWKVETLPVTTIGRPVTPAGM